jgi:hypothetical protein
MLDALPLDMLTWGGRTPAELDYETATLLNSHGVCGDEATVRLVALMLLLLSAEREQRRRYDWRTTFVVVERLLTSAHY